jgi:hypothetical protein
MAQTFIIVFDTQSALGRHPRRDWSIFASVDGRMICKPVKKRTSKVVTRVGTMVSSQNGQLVEGKLVFAKLVST